MGTSRDHRHLMERGLGVLLLLALLQTGTEAQNCPSSSTPLNGRIDENSAVGAVVLTIPVSDGVTLGPVPTGPPFELRGKDIVTTATLDFEDTDIRILIIVNNLNDNIPTFEQGLYTLSIPELTPVNTVLGTYAAVDRDEESLFYTLTSTSDVFRLKSRTEPQLILAKALQYDDIQSAQLTLVVQDSDPPTDLHSATTTISITIQDEDNRPPWFRPCNEIDVQGITICPNTGYTGTVNLGEQLSGPLPLKPNAILAIDGDKGINEPVKYALLSDGDGVFAIEENTGAITMLKAVGVTTIIHMTVMASQVTNTFQFATTSLTVSVVTKSNHPPQFERTAYEAVVEGVGSMAVEAADKNKAVKILATDQDFGVGGINPNIVYTIPGNTDFSVISGFLFMTADATAGSYNMEVVATDTENLQNATAQLTVEVVKEPTTTAPPTTVSSPTPEQNTGDTTVPTTDPTSPVTDPTGPATDPTGPATDPTGPATDPTGPATDPTGPATDPTGPATDPTGPATDPTGPATDPTGPATDPTGPATDPTGPVTDPSTNPSSPGTTGSGVESPVTSTPGSTGDEINPPGDFTSADMAALGATLGVLLFICIVVITVLAIKLRKGDSNWKKINEASAFRSSLGPSGQKEGVQYTNEAFQHDDNDKDDKGGPPGSGLRNGTVPSDKPQTRSLPRPPSPIPDDEKEVKPILSKDRSKEDGYKAVWFKEDIDPDAKEEVVIIPDSREEEDDDEEDESDEETKIPKVKFNDADGDSGLGEKMDSEEDRVFTSL